MSPIQSLAALRSPASAAHVGAEIVAPVPAWATGLGVAALVSFVGLAAYGIIVNRGEERKLKAQGEFDRWERKRRMRVFDEAPDREATVAEERAEFARKLAAFRAENKE